MSGRQEKKNNIQLYANMSLTVQFYCNQFGFGGRQMICMAPCINYITLGRYIFTYKRIYLIDYATPSLTLAIQSIDNTAVINAFGLQFVVDL